MGPGCTCLPWPTLLRVVGYWLQAIWYKLQSGEPAWLHALYASDEQAQQPATKAQQQQVQHAAPEGRAPGILPMPPPAVLEVFQQTERPRPPPLTAAAGNVRASWQRAWPGWPLDPGYAEYKDDIETTHVAMSLTLCAADDGC